MPGSTTVLGMPYPLSSDDVRDGDDTIKALAERVESQLMIKMGRHTGNTDASGNLSWAHGLGVIPRAVVVTPVIASNAWIVMHYLPGTTSTNIQVVVRTHLNAAVASTSVTVNWYAVG